MSNLLVTVEVREFVKVKETCSGNLGYGETTLIYTICELGPSAIMNIEYANNS